MSHAQEALECIETKPTTQTVYVNSTPVNLSAIARKYKINQGYLSRIFAGKQTPSISIARKICDSIGMGLEEFLTGVQPK